MVGVNAMDISPARLGSRCNAFARTSVMVFICGLAATLVNSSCFPLDSYLIILYKLPEQSADKITAVLLWLPAVLWFLADGTKHKATYGMRKAGLSFRTKNGTTTGRLRCLLRLTVGILTLPVLPLSCIVALIDRKRRTVSDLVCGVVVVGPDLRLEA